jgi:hypothetical protein
MKILYESGAMPPRACRMSFFLQLTAIDKFISSLPVRLDETLPKLVEFTQRSQSTQLRSTTLPA